jgi:hypothetical protein
MARRIYQEVQMMRDTGMAYIFGGMSLLGLIGIIISLATKNDVNIEEVILTSSIIAAALFLMVWLFYSLKLEVKIDENRISYRMPPLINKEKFIHRDEIEEFEVLEYQPIRQYGGWGIRFSMKHGKAITISGKEGLFITLKTGKKLLLGTRKKEDIRLSMVRMMKRTEDYG